MGAVSQELVAAGNDARLQPPRRVQPRPSRGIDDVPADREGRQGGIVVDQRRSRRTSRSCSVALTLDPEPRTLVRP